MKREICMLEREKKEREGERGEREVRSKLGTATGNFFSSKRDVERYGLDLVYVFIILKIPSNAGHNS
jgi:hypothetical protein